MTQARSLFCGSEFLYGRIDHGLGKVGDLSLRQNLERNETECPRRLIHGRDDRSEKVLAFVASHESNPHPIRVRGQMFNLTLTLKTPSWTGVGFLQFRPRDNDRFDLTQLSMTLPDESWRLFLHGLHGILSVRLHYLAWQFPRGDCSGGNKNAR